MASSENYRLYTFVANLYLSPLQCGLQTAHVVSEIAADTEMLGRQQDAFDDWCRLDKTIIICAAANHRGVLDCWTEIERINSALNLPAALFREDEDSMNGMATACGVVVPEKYWNVHFYDEADTFDKFGQLVKHTDAYWEHGLPNGQMVRYPLTHPEGQFISHIKKYRLA